MRTAGIALVLLAAGGCPRPGPGTEMPLDDAGRPAADASAPAVAFDAGTEESGVPADDSGAVATPPADAGGGLPEGAGDVFVPAVPSTGDARVADVSDDPATGDAGGGEGPAEPFPSTASRCPPAGDPGGGAAGTAGEGGAIRPVSVRIVGRAVPEGPWTDGPTAARLADAPELAAVVEGREGRGAGRTVWVVDDEVSPLRIGGRAVPEDRRRSWEGFEAVAVRWSTVEPHAWRPAGVVAPNGSETPYYSNVVSGGPNHGRWLGYDEVHYFETPAGDWRAGPGARRRPASARPPRAADDVWDGLGTMRWRVEACLGDGTVLATPGADATDGIGIRASVHRVTIRRDDTFLGHLTGYFMVPEIFGSAGRGDDHQTERYVGADCADVLFGALRAGGRDVDYGSVSGLTSYAAAVGGPAEFGDDGMPVDDGIEGVRVGDVVRIDYGGDYAGSTPRSWDHVAVLYEDRSDPDGPLRGAADGSLNGWDLVVHMGHPMLKIQTLSGQTPATLDVLRWTERTLR